VVAYVLMNKLPAAPQMIVVMSLIVLYYCRQKVQQSGFVQSLLIPRYIIVSFAIVEFGSFCLVRRSIDINPRFLTRIDYTPTCLYYFHSNIALNVAINFVEPYIFDHSWDNDSHFYGGSGTDFQKWTFFWTSHVAVIYAFQS